MSWSARSPYVQHSNLIISATYPYTIFVYYRSFNQFDAPIGVLAWVYALVITYGLSKNGQWFYFEIYCASKLVVNDDHLMIQWCGLFYKLVNSIWIIAFGSKPDQMNMVMYLCQTSGSNWKSIRFEKVELQKSRSNRAKIILFNAIISSFKITVIKCM